MLGRNVLNGTKRGARGKAQAAGVARCCVRKDGCVYKRKCKVSEWMGGGSDRLSKDWGRGGGRGDEVGQR